MRIVFLSNFLNHHQLSLCFSFVKLTNNSFYFVATEPVPEDRISLGYENMNDMYSFVIPTYKSKRLFDYAMKIVFDAEVVIIGSAPEKFIKNRIKAKKIIFRYYERIYKEKPNYIKLPFRAIKYFKYYAGYVNQYILCASAYTARDYRLTGSFIGKYYKWGYFPKTYKYDIKELINKKKHNSILWVGRLIDWKHPEVAVLLAKDLKSIGFDFCLSILGEGNMSDLLAHMIDQYQLSDCVKMLGSVSHNEVREIMEKTEFFIATSDRNEGWGAVINEAMNSACVVVANSEIGAVPYLINNNINGVVYNKGKYIELREKIIKLLRNNKIRKDLATEAYKTITNLWNAEKAASRFIKLTESLQKNNSCPYKSGPCSRD